MYYFISSLVLISVSEEVLSASSSSHHPLESRCHFQIRRGQGNHRNERRCHPKGHTSSCHVNWGNGSIITISLSKRAEEKRQGNVIPSFLFPKLNEVDHSVGVAAGLVLVLIREESKSDDIFLITISLTPTLTSIYWLSPILSLRYNRFPDLKLNSIASSSPVFAEFHWKIPCFIFQIFIFF
jgi:hypothetical protein